MYITKKAVFTTFTLSTVGFTTYLLANENKRKQIMDKLKNVYAHVRSAKQNKSENNQKLIPKIGHPHPRDEGDNNMVSEGAMYSVKYYNEQKE